MSRIIKQGAIVLGLIAYPAVVFAQVGDFENIHGLITGIKNIINDLIPIVFTFALLVFFWGIAKYILALGSEEKKNEGKQIMLWGVIALFVMSSIWGIVYFLQNTLGVGHDSLMTVPTLDL